MSYVGIDYGCGLSNVDRETGIRFGVIPANDLGDSWYESSEGDYGPPMCGECGNEAVEIDEVPFDLDDCKTLRQEGWRKHDVLEIPEEQQEKCGRKEWRDEGRDYACLECCRSFDSDDAWGDDGPVFGHNLDDGEYKAHQGNDDCDVFVLKSPYYTRAQFCSPCAPGAAYLRNPCEDGPKAYCFAPDWFRPWDDDQVTGEYCGEKTSCPYPVWTVDGDELIFAPKAKGCEKCGHSCPADRVCEKCGGDAMQSGDTLCCDCDK